MRRTFLAMVGVLAILSLAIPGDSPKVSADDCKKCETPTLKSVVHLQGNGTPGLWITNTSDKSQGLVSIYNSDTQGPAIGLYSKQAMKDSPSAMTVAIHLDEKGNPCIQVYGADKEIRHIDLVKLAKMVESCKCCSDCPDCKKCPTK